MFFQVFKLPWVDSVYLGSLGHNSARTPVDTIAIEYTVMDTIKNYQNALRMVGYNLEMIKMVHFSVAE